MQNAHILEKKNLSWNWVKQCQHLGDEVTWIMSLRTAWYDSDFRISQGYIEISYLNNIKQKSRWEKSIRKELTESPFCMQGWVMVLLQVRRRTLIQNRERSREKGIYWKGTTLRMNRHITFIRQDSEAVFQTPLSRRTLTEPQQETQYELPHILPVWNRQRNVERELFPKAVLNMT